MPRASFTGTAAEKRFMEHKWCEKLWQAMSREAQEHHYRKGSGARSQAKCKNDERQTEALLAKARDWPGARTCSIPRARNR